MLVIELELQTFALGEKIDSYTRGHITIKDQESIITSKHRKPDQSMMIFLSLVQLLDAIRDFLSNRQIKKHSNRPIKQLRYVGVDSSFQFYIYKDNKMFTILGEQKQEIEKITADELIESIWKGVMSFLSLYGSYITPDELVFEDLQNSLKEFKEIFKIQN